MGKTKRNASIGTVLLAVVIVLAVRLLGPPTSPPRADDATPPSDAAARATATDAAEIIRAAFNDRRSDLIVEFAAVVDRTLPDDNEGSRHQRFIARLRNDHTVLIAHNIDLAPRVPLTTGDTVTIKGEYEWNDQGGVVHWTHHDPAGRHPGGWIEHRGSRYE